MRAGDGAAYDTAHSTSLDPADGMDVPKDKLLCSRQDRHATGSAGANCSARRQVDEGRGPLPVFWRTSASGLQNGQPADSNPNPSPRRPVPAGK